MLKNIVRGKKKITIKNRIVLVKDISTVTLLSIGNRSTSASRYFSNTAAQIIWYKISNIYKLEMSNNLQMVPGRFPFSLPFFTPIECIWEVLSALMDQ